MKKQDLKTGDKIEFQDGTKALVMLNTRRGDKYVKIGSGGGYWTHGGLNQIDENFAPRNDYNIAGDIIKIFKPREEYTPLPEHTEYKLVWERKPQIELDVKINGKEAKLSDLSEETLLNLREEN